MSFGSVLGSSSVSGGIGHIFENADSLNVYENDHPATWAIDPLGSMLGGVLKSSEKKKAKKQLKYYQQQLQMEYDFQKKYAQEMALEMPALYRQGFEDAGYNALLALGNTGGATSAFSPRAGAGDFPHESKKSAPNLLVSSALETQAVQREKIKADTKKTKIDMIVDAIKGLASSAATAFAAYAAAKGFTSRGVPIAKGVRRAAGRAVGRGSGRAVSSAAASSAAGTAAASLFTRAIAPAAALGGLTYGVSEAKKAVEKKYGKLPDATDRKYQRMNPRFTGQDDDPRRRRYR